MMKLWNNYQSGIRKGKPDFDMVIDRLEEFLEPIFQAIIMEEEWFCIWDSSAQKWL